MLPGASFFSTDGDGAVEAGEDGFLKNANNVPEAGVAGSGLFFEDDIN
jgi:hypothetical protein